MRVSFASSRVASSFGAASGYVCPVGEAAETFAVSMVLRQATPSTIASISWIPAGASETRARAV
jgi:hypothetical protein